MLEISNYNSAILKDISFSLKSKENLIILGENGAGKSTLAKVLTNLIENNCVYLNGKNIDNYTYEDRAKLINYIPPKLEIFDEYVSLREYLELSFVGRVDNNKIDKIIELLNLKRLEKKACISFSSGEKQLVLLASSILHNAQITIFDELTANLDISRLKEVYDIFQSGLLQQKIIISHNLDLAYALKYKVLYLKDGKIEFFGEHESFFSEENLKKFYNETIIKMQNHLVVNL